MKKVDVLILGGGIAGLGAHMSATSKGRSAEIFEKKSSAGGLLDNFKVGGFRFDNAVHLSFATEPEVRAVFDKTPYFTHPADSLNFEKDKWLKHPVQNNLYPLDAEEKVELITSLIDRDKNEPGDNYESWLRHQYGDAIAERYPMKYTRKYWQTEAKELSTAWIGNRMRRADLAEILHGAFTSETPNTYYTKEMRYPKKGGYRAFIDSLINDAEINCSKEAVFICMDTKVVQFACGESVQFESLVNTLPLPIFVEICVQAPQNVVEAAKELSCTSIDLISVGFSEIVAQDLWFYIYDEDMYASRAYSPSVKSPDNAPEGCSSLQFEIYNGGRNSQYTPDQLIENVRYSLKKMNISDGKNILFAEHKHLPWGNVVFDKKLEGNRKVVLDFLSACGIYTCGRFGLWEYFWSNQAFMSGYTLKL